MNAIDILREFRYELIAFTTGASVMMLEIVGARLIAPYLGTSVYVWTAMIGTILGALAVGYWLGGRLADKPYDHRQLLAVVLAGAAVLVLMTAFMQDMTLNSVAAADIDLRIGALLAGVVLFGPPSLLIGMVMPHVAKIRITSLDTTGRSIGRLEAAGAVGSIAGTFACGYWLLGYVGSENIALAIVVVLVLTSFLAHKSVFLWLRVSIAVIAVLVMVVPQVEAAGILADVDSSYGRYRVIESELNGRTTHSLVTDPFSIQSQIFVDDPGEPALSYIQRFMEVFVNLDASNVLVIGGGAHTFPTALVQRSDTVDVTVVEIDPKLDELASEYFAFKQSERLRVVHADGRAYLNQQHGPYDVLYVDAFSSLTPPFQLATEEAVIRMAAGVAPDGVVVVNVIGSYGGSSDNFANAMYTTFRAGFADVHLYQVAPEFDLQRRQNLLLVASNSNDALERAASSFGDLEIPSYKPGLMLTDDYAPVERLTY